VRISTDSQHYISEEWTLPFISISVISNDHFILRRKFSSNLTLRSRALWRQERGCSQVSAFPNLLHKSQVRIACSQVSAFPNLLHMLTSQCVSKFATQIKSEDAHKSVHFQIYYTNQEWEFSQVSALPNLPHKSRVRMLKCQCVSKFTTQIKSEDAQKSVRFQIYYTNQEWEFSQVSAFPNLLHKSLKSEDAQTSVRFQIYYTKSLGSSHLRNSLHIVNWVPM